MCLIKDLMGLQQHKQKHAQKPSDQKQQHRPLAPYCLFIHHDHTEECIQNMKATFIDVKRLLRCVLQLLLAVSQSRFCSPCVCWPELLKRPS